MDYVIYLSDGAPSHFKNYKTFCNIAFHETDFGKLCEWHFCASGHGKGQGVSFLYNQNKNYELAMTDQSQVL